MNDTQFEPELDRIRRVYERRAGDSSLRHLYSPLAPAPMVTVQAREWALASLMRRIRRSDLSDLDILDIGCGSGVELLRFALYGADPARMAGIDLMPDRVRDARRLLPEADLREGSAHRTGYPDASFDLVTQFTTFSSIAQPEMRQAIAAEMLRVLRPQGSIFWYDVRRLPRPNPDLVGIELDELRALFPGRPIRTRTTTLEWGILHRVAPRSRSLAQLLERAPMLCSHYAALVGPASGSGRS